MVAVTLIAGDRSGEVPRALSVGVAAMAVSVAIMNLRMSVFAGTGRGLLAVVGDGATVIAYVIYGITLVRVIVKRAGTGAVPAMLDGLILSVGISTVGWIAVVEPMVRTSDFGNLDQAMMVGCLAGDLLLLWLGALAVASDPSGSRRLRAFVASSVSLLLANELHVLAGRFGTPIVASVGDTVGLAAFAVLAIGFVYSRAADESARIQRNHVIKIRALALVFMTMSVPALIVGLVRTRDTSLGATLSVGMLFVGVVIARVLVLVKSIQGARLDLEFRASHDQLTGIANRAFVLDHLTRVDRRRLDTGCTNAVLYIDLDKFKEVNDKHGHTVGDALLRQVGEKLKQTTRSHELAARIGGDEFVVVAENIDPTNAVKLADRILHAIGQITTAHGTPVTVKASAGIAFERGEDSPLAMLKDADHALYAAKNERPGHAMIFDSSLRKEVDDRLSLEQAIADAIARNEFELYYQPIVCIRTNRPIGAEALIRWNRPGHGLVMPDQFVPVAEASNLVADVDSWALRRALAQQATWSSHTLLKDATIHVNMSARSLLSPNAAESVDAQVRSANVPKAQICIEVTETSLPEDFALAATAARHLNRQGIDIAIDDFGTGFASLTYLRELAPSVIKVDRSFIAKIHSHEGHSIVKLIAAIGTTLDLQVVAEGVETSAQLEAAPRSRMHLRSGLLPRQTHASSQARSVGRTEQLQLD